FDPLIVREKTIEQVAHHRVRMSGGAVNDFAARGTIKSFRIDFMHEYKHPADGGEQLVDCFAALIGGLLYARFGARFQVREIRFRWRLGHVISQGDEVWRGELFYPI